MPLHPEARRVIERARDTNSDPAPIVLDAQAMREGFQLSWTMPDHLPAVGSVRDDVIPGPGGDIPVRIYTPDGAGPFPVFVWFHGGGWTIGCLDENEFACRTVAAGADAVVVSVDYRLAPENPYPAAADDSYAAVRWLHEHGERWSVDPDRIAVGGESAGGNLAAVVALKARDLAGPPIALQVLVSPVVGHPDDGRASYADFADGYFMSKASMDWFFEQYPRDAADLADPYLLPLRAADLSGLPPALVLGAEYDVLRDEGEDYARALRAAGNDAETIRLDGLIHGFFGLLATDLTDASKAHAHVIHALRDAFAKERS
ncbi:alpha/beta hydrolase [Streptomyces sp. SID3343]|uniref:alpha/beta hydrolase n=1 Tax=Streptomyces sp. SID3343 TaxID=2690260 RepID=UPI001371F24B|nr:alpha/beta hydrolase [Streptomyces sp. SID3343]MYW00017.1 alpha/beta hydrolase fold domain-containing protein [Streptomyces sp. SID3343]